MSASQLKALAHSPVEYYHRSFDGEVGPRKSAELEYGTPRHLWAERFWDEARQYPEKVPTATEHLGKEAKGFAAAALLPLPSAIHLLGHTNLPHHLAHGLSLSQPSLSLAELPDDQLRSQLLPLWHLLPSVGLHHQRLSLRNW